MAHDRLSHERLSGMVNSIAADDAARGWIGTGDWKRVWKTLYPYETAHACAKGGLALAMRADVRDAVRRIQNERITERLSKDNLLSKLEDILEDKEERTGDRLSAIKLYADLAGMTTEDRKQMTTIVLSAGDVRVLEDARARCLPAPEEAQVVEAPAVAEAARPEEAAHVTIAE